MKLTPGLTRIQGQRCVLIEDTVSGSFPKHSDIVPVTYSNHVAIFCSYKHLVRVRRSHPPSTPVYGIWQIIFATQQVWKGRMFALYFNEMQDEGMLLLHEDGVFNSCRIKSGKVVSPLSIDLSEASHIDVKLDDLVLPSKPILTRDERETAIRIRTHRWAGLTGTLAISAIMMFLIGHEWLDYWHHAHSEAQQKQLQETAQLKQEYVYLQKQRLPQWPQQWNVLTPFARLAHQTIPFEVWGIQFEQPVIRAKFFPMVAGGTNYLPQWMAHLPGVEFVEKDDFVVEVSWRNTEVGEAP